MKVSVAMASYNGEKYIAEQIQSILKNLRKDDELVISDDGSKDKTIEIIKRFKDKRIKLIDGPKKGIKQNFANAIKTCTGDIIFLADQDDIWSEDKVSTVLEIFAKDPNCTCVVHDCEVFDDSTNRTIEASFFKWRKSGSGIIKNIWKNTYIGCCMAFRSNIKPYILPIPDDIEMHDQWIGLICEKHGESTFIPNVLLKYRRHNQNNSKMVHHPLSRMLANRLSITKHIAKRGRK